MQHDARRYAPATLRNRAAILAVLLQCLPKCGLMLEVASGSGEHVVHFAVALPQLSFQPSDPDADALASIDAWAAVSGVTNVRRALALDAAAAEWPVTRADAVLCINMIHIAPWAATPGLLQGAARVLAPGGLLYLYGPFRQDSRHTAPNNEIFDRDLHASNPAWGVRDLEVVAAEADAWGFGAPEVIAMPANNLSVLFRRSA